QPPLYHFAQYTTDFFITVLGHALAVRVLAGPGAVEEISAGSPAIFRWGLLCIGILPTWGFVRFDLSRVSPADRRLVAVAGPLASVAVAAAFGVAAAILPMDAGWRQAFLAMAQANLAMAGFNLLPIPPLYGWTILETWLRFDRDRLEFLRRVGAGVVFTVSVWVALWLLTRH
ncbi:M50 family metallopeptidase, partial [Acidithiobacillus caldus]